GRLLHPTGREPTPLICHYFPQDAVRLAEVRQSFTLGAEGGTRTHKGGSPPHFECGAFASFATPTAWCSRDARSAGAARAAAHRREGPSRLIGLPCRRRLLEFRATLGLYTRNTDDLIVVAIKADNLRVAVLLHFNRNVCICK